MEKAKRLGKAKNPKKKNKRIKKQKGTKISRNKIGWVIFWLKLRIRGYS